MVHAFMIISADQALEGPFSTETVPIPQLFWWQCYTAAWNLPRPIVQRALGLVGQRVLADLALSLACSTSFKANAFILNPSQQSSSASQQVSNPAGSSMPGASTTQGGIGSTASNTAAAAAAADAVMKAPPEGCLRATVRGTDVYPVASRSEEAAEVANSGADALWTMRKTARVLWRYVPQLCAAACMILEDTDSLSLAQHSLAVVAKVLCEQQAAPSLLHSVRSGGAADPASLRKFIFEQRPEETAAIVDRYLPSGTLLIMPQAYQKKLRKDVENLVSSKT